MPDQGLHGIVTFRVQAQIRGLVITHQQSLAFKEAAYSMSDGVCQVCELSAGRCGYPAKPRTRTGVIHIDAIEEQHMEMDRKSLGAYQRL
jgi:hypothetical protein